MLKTQWLPWLPYELKEQVLICKSIVQCICIRQTAIDKRYRQTQAVPTLLSRPFLHSGVVHGNFKNIDISHAQ